MNKCPLCKTSYVNNLHCGLRLFNSENECAICLEKKDMMIALPCGHQFCQEDLKKIGLFTLKKIKPKKKKSKKRRRPALPIQPPNQRRRTLATLHNQSQRQQQTSMNSVARSAQISSHSMFIPNTHVINLSNRRSLPPSQRASRVRRGPKRCGWCGHLGHTIRKCVEHRIHCNCTSLKTARHKMIHRRKHVCILCNKKGHQAVTCSQIVPNL